MDRDYDVIVIGSGAAGLSAALSAAEANPGASILVVEADTQVGGSSRLSGGHFYAAGTSVQAEAGETGDTPDAMFEHYMTLNQWLVEPGVVRRYCDESAPTFEWLKDHGVEFPVEGVYASGVGSTRRGHQPTGGGEAVVQALEAGCGRHQIDFVLNSRVDELLVDDAGHVGGVSIQGDRATCGAVVMAAGGFGANPAMLAEHYPDAAAAGNWGWYIGSPRAQGDGLTLGQQVGAAVTGHNRGLLLVTPGFSRDLEVLLPHWLILINAQGRRFVNESAPYTVLGGAIQHQAGPVYAVFDQAALLAAKPSPISQAFWVRDTLERELAAGNVKSGDSVEALARQIEVAPGALASTLDLTNRDAADGVDSQCFKPGGVQAISRPPFYAAEVKPAIICWTGTGLRINADTQVLNEQHQPIPGLYAAGETVGSLHGDRYIGGGGSFGPCIVFGRLAGQKAAAFATV